MIRIVFTVLCIFLWTDLFTQDYEIERFDLLNNDDGLSQNVVLSLYCDSHGYIWAGTMNGLNRYDGYNFKVFRSHKNVDYSLVNNRIIDIWEDRMGFIWLRTHDNKLHYLDLSTERFFTFPEYSGQISSITSYLQVADNEIWLGSDLSGVYRLNYCSDSVYRYSHFKNKGRSALSNNSISFILKDWEENLWIGTRQGLNKIPGDSRNHMFPRIEHHLVEHSFTNGAIARSDIWFGTKNHGVYQYNGVSKTFEKILLPGAEEDVEITYLEKTRLNNHILIGTTGYGLYLYDLLKNSFTNYDIPGSSIKSVYEDRFGALWVTSTSFGVTMINPRSAETRFFQLTPDNIKHLIDFERLFFFEDSRDILWIGVHGGGLVSFDRDNESMTFYRNDPYDPNSISSNFVHCIAEDNSGLLWVGTGQFNGGLNKAYPMNPTFRQFRLQKRVDDLSENVVRCIFEDKNKNLWVANKAGQVYIYRDDFSLLRTMETLPVIKGFGPAFNIYTFFQDHQGYLWMGSKGGGIAVTTQPLNKYHQDYSDICFVLYQHDKNDSNSLSNNMVYSIYEDPEHRIWIATYGGGINLVKSRNRNQMVCQHISTENSNLSSDFVRDIYIDSLNRYWFGTIYGLQLLVNDNLSDSLLFRSFICQRDNPNSICYNDISEIFEDSRGQLWFCTIGGGISILESLDGQAAEFRTINQENGLINDATYAILEDSLGFLWVSTVNGISRIDPSLVNIENFNKNNGLQSNQFSENTAFAKHDGNLLFGNTGGVLVVSPGLIEKPNFILPIVFTDLYISNVRVNFHSDNSPIDKPVDFYDTLVLDHDQSSFSLEYAALSFFDPNKNQFAYMLEKYDDDWNYMYHDRRANYTKVPPGTYAFHVKASNWDGTWNENPRKMTIIIKPPWWETTWMRIIFLAILLVILEISRRIFMNYYRMKNNLRLEKRVNEIKLQFFTNISHEIRTPLTLIMGPVEDIRRIKNLSATILEPLEIIQRNSKRMLRLLNQLLDFRKIQNKKMKLKVQQVNLGSFLKEVCHNFDYLALQKNIYFQYPMEMEETLVWFDPVKMDTVLFNILSNAFKFTSSEKCISVEVNHLTGQDFFEIIISDEGVGIPEEKLSLMFQRYISLDNENINLTGTGIGMALSNEIVKVHHGELNVESKLNEGSRFIIRLPVGNHLYTPEEIVSEEIAFQPVEHEQYELPVLNQAPMETDAGDCAKKEKPTLLLVEDHYDVRQYVRKVLVSDFNILEATNGKEGLNLVSETHPDLIITDLMMPVMDGLVMTKKLKEDFSTCHIPVIMLTAKSGIDNQIEGISSGAETYILKPFNALYLKTVISNLLQQRGLYRQMLLSKKEYQASEIKITNRDEKFMQDVIRIIEDNYHRPDFKVNRLVELSCVGRTVFYNKIKSLTGMPPVQFLRQIRIKIAAGLLVNNGYNISEIAYMTGFNDIKYFRECFKNVYGLTPSAYKKKQTTE